MISIIVLLAVFILIAVRQIGNFKLQIWQIMLGGAFAVLITGVISIPSALNSINTDVILFLFGMFVIGQALEESGYLSFIENKFFSRAKSVQGSIILILLVTGFTSSFLMNDTVAIIGTPIVLMIANRNGLNPKLFLLTLAFAVTIGSTASPIGNPQNLLIAISGNIKNPFTEFIRYLFVPTLINLFAAYFIIKFFFKEEFPKKIFLNKVSAAKDVKLMILSKVSLGIVFLLILLKICFIVFIPSFNFKLTYIAVISSLPIILFSNTRFAIVKNIDWGTLIFFAAMFILMQSVWDTGYFQEILKHLGFNITSIILILAVSVLLSQFISNVPLVALYLPLLIHLGVTNKELAALAAGSTIAGNLFILGAASNIIIIQNAEKRNGASISFWDFAKLGIPLTMVNVLICYLYLIFI